MGNLMTLFAGGSGAGGGEQTLTLQPDGASGIDTYLDEAQPTANVGNSPALLCSNNAGARNVILIKFDLSSLAGKTIVSAALSLWNANVMPNPATFTLYRILAANSTWTEGDAGWDYTVAPALYWAGDTGADGGIDAGCTASGTDYHATELGNLVTAGQAGNTELQFTLDPTQFAALVAANYGMVMFSNNNAISSFRSSDYSTVTTRRPKLVVVYTD